ncbi:hypothetical protein IF1G_04645 [Cordyceps javanica]|uniref:Uncharacterized protein n=1 Tax=Cordyceps javanica TaxID=43265 RepID=A0A545V2Y5_9HYPO|nr:hypothetical protein IF1G_04645 [Cordyceps javanica]
MRREHWRRDGLVTGRRGCSKPTSEHTKCRATATIRNGIRIQIEIAASATLQWDWIDVLLWNWRCRSSGPNHGEERRRERRERRERHTGSLGQANWRIRLFSASRKGKIAL